MVLYSPQPLSFRLPYREGLPQKLGQPFNLVLLPNVVHRGGQSLRGVKVSLRGAKVSLPSTHCLIDGHGKGCEGTTKLHC